MNYIRSLTCITLLYAALPEIALGQQQSDRDITQRLDALQTSVEAISKKVEANKEWSVKDLFTWIGGPTALIAAIVSGVAVWVNRGMSMRTLTQKANEEKAKNLQEKLDKFYGPLVQLRNQSRLLYQALKARQPNPEDFRTLTALLSGTSFQGNEKVLLDEIIKIGGETESLIKQLSGLVDEDLQEVLGKATTHYLVLRLAHGGLLQRDASQFETYVFPRELDDAIKQKVEKIKEELATLRAVS